MARSKMTIERKKDLIMEYREKTGTFKKIVAEEVAEWANKNCELSVVLHGYDLCRPKELREWIDFINQRIVKYGTADADEGTTDVVCENGIDIVYLLQKSKDPGKLQAELQKVNKRIFELYASIRKLSAALRKATEEKENAEKELEALSIAHRDLQQQLEDTRKKCRNEVKEAISKQKEAERECRLLNKYINEFIYDPVMAHHFTNDLGMLLPSDGARISIPDHLKKLLHDDKPFGETIMDFETAIHDTDEEDVDMGKEDAAVKGTVLTEEETNALNIINKLLEE